MRHTRRPAAILAIVCATAAPAQDGPPPFAAFDRASEAVLNDPHDLTLGPDGRLYVADKFGARVVVMDAETLEVVGTIGAGALPQVRDVSFGPDGRLHAAVTGLGAVVAFDLSGPEPVATATLGPFPRTEGALAHSLGRIYAMASGTGELIAVEDGQVVAVAGGMFGAHDVAEAPDGSVWVADNASRRLVRFSPDLERLQVLDDARFGFRGPRYLDVEPDGILVVADQDAHRILRIDPVSGDLLGVIGSGRPGAGPGLFDDPEGIAAGEGVYWVSDSDNNRVVRYVVVVN